MSPILLWWRRRLELRSEDGLVAVMIAIFVPVLFIGLAAIAVDTAQWSLEKARIQKAADAAALAGVPYMPQNVAAAIDRAREVAAVNGFDYRDPAVDVAVGQGGRPSELEVHISSRVNNTFGAAIGVASAVVDARAVADYQSSAPMGSPCNTFGNEPSSGGGASSPLPKGTARGASGPANCSSNPQFWAQIHAPGTDKEHGDRFQALKCTSAGTERCSGGQNAEYDPVGYFYDVKVSEAAVGTPVTIQLYDPAYVYTASNCSALPTAGSFKNNMNPYVSTEAAARYSRQASNSSTGSPYCSGDVAPDFSGASTELMTTSFLMREQNDSENPRVAAVIPGCVKQYTGLLSAPTAAMLDKDKTAYNPELAAVFHNWTTLCAFTPSRAGDYYLQVRSGVAPGGTTASNNSKANIIYSGNPNAAAATTNTTRGQGANSFAIRAVTEAGLETSVSVSAHERMPIYANANSANTVFNLLRVLPGAAGKYISFTFYDVGDISGAAGGAVTVLTPSDGTGSIVTNPFPGKCRSQGGAAGADGMALTDCSASITRATNNGVAQEIIIPIPSDYSCNYTSPAGCWYRVKVSFPGATVTDATTWTGSVIGDPVRLVR